MWWWVSTIPITLKYARLSFTQPDHESRVRRFLPLLDFLSISSLLANQSCEEWARGHHCKGHSPCRLAIGIVWQFCCLLSGLEVWNNRERPKCKIVDGQSGLNPAPTCLLLSNPEKLCVAGLFLTIKCQHLIFWSFREFTYSLNRMLHLVLEYEAWNQFLKWTGFEADNGVYGPVWQAAMTMCCWLTSATWGNPIDTILSNSVYLETRQSLCILTSLLKWKAWNKIESHDV